MADLSSIETKIITYLSSLPTWTTSEEKETAKETDLMATGVIDSVNIIQLILFIEKEFGIRVEAHDLVEDNFKTIPNMIRFVDRRIGADHA